MKPAAIMDSSGKHPLHSIEPIATMAGAISSARTLREIFRGLFLFAVETTPADAIFVALYDSSEKTRRCVYTANHIVDNRGAASLEEEEDEDLARFPELPLTTSPQSQAIRERRAVNVPDFQAAVEGLVGGVDGGSDFKQRPPRSSVAIPLTVDDSILGALELQSTEPAAFDDSHLPALTMAAKLAAVALRNLDLLERERSARLAVERSEARFRSLVQNSSDVIRLLDAEGNLLYESPSIKRVLGYEPRARGDGSAFERIHPDDRQWLREALSQAMETGSGEATYRVRHANGEWRWIEALGRNMLDDPNVGAFVLNSRDITERKRAEDAVEALNRSLEERVQHLSSLRDIDRAIAGSLDLRFVLNVLLSQVRCRLGVDAAAVLLHSTESSSLRYEAHQGLRGSARPARSRTLGEGDAGWLRLARDSLREVDVEQFTKAFLPVRGPLPEEYRGYRAVPLLAKGKIQGVLELFAREELTFDEEWYGYLDSMAAQAAIAIDNAVLFEGLERSNAALRRAYDTTIEGWARALDLRDHETVGHSRRVTEMTLALARELGVREADLVQIRWGSLLHDIGKMGVPDAILLKPGELSREEWGLMKRHTEYARDLLAPIEFLSMALEIPYSHHEKWDGTGYPQGLKGEQIPLPARIFAVVDVYDAITSERPYHAAWSEESALEFIRGQSGQHFEPRIVDAFLKLLERTNLNR